MARLQRRGRARQGRGDVQRPGCLPQVRRWHVPLVHGHPGRGALHPRTGESAAPDSQRRDADGRAVRRSAVRGAGPVCRVQGLQGRVPLGCGPGQNQVRSPGSSTSGPAHVTAGPGVRRDSALLRLASIAPGMANALASSLPARAVLSLVGVQRERPLPRLAPLSFDRWFREHEVPEPSRGEVVLFDDTFTNYVHPEVGAAMVMIIEALGYRVIRFEQRTCCGRPSISKGLLDHARSQARQNLDALLSHAEAGAPIIGAEPSCLLSLRDEYPLLLPGEDSAVVARQALLFDEWLDRELQQDDAPEIFAGDHGRLLLHTHCHQKALADSTRRSASCAARDTSRTRLTAVAVGWPVRSASRPSTTTSPDAWAS